jgi:anaerobic magnesium-protoporphyrin IX monomethyl ester cyclase
MKKRFKVLLVYPNLHMMLVPSTAIGLFTKILKQDGFEVDLFDTTHYEHSTTISTEKRVETLQYRPFNPETDVLWRPLSNEKLIPDFINKINLFSPDLLLFSVVEDTFKQAVMLLDSIADNKIPALFGGVFITAAPEVALSYPSVKMVGVGEGEHIVKSVARNLRDNKSLDNIPNLWIKKENGQIIKNPPGSLMDVNIEIPDFSLFDHKRFLRPMGGRVFKTLPLETFRGCPFQCTFCNSPMQVRFAKDNKLGNFLRTKNVERIRMAILDLIETYQPEYLYILDDSFLSRPKRELDAFIEMYSEFKIPFWFNTRPESVNAESLKQFIEIGLDRLSVGLEHGNFDFRKNVLKRNPSNETLLEHLEIIANSGVSFSINNIIGFPTETRELIFKTIEFNRLIRGFDALTISIFTPYQGTELRELAIKENYYDSESLTTHTTSSSLLNMPHLTSEQIDGIFRTFLMYVRFEKELWPEIERAESFTSEGNRIWKQLFNLYQERYYKTDQDGFPIKQTVPNDVTIKHPKGDDWEEVFGPMSKTQMR